MVTKIIITIKTVVAVIVSIIYLFIYLFIFIMYIYIYISCYIYNSIICIYIFWSLRGGGRLNGNKVLKTFLSYPCYFRF